MRTQLLAEKQKLQNLINSVADSDSAEHVPGKEYRVRYEDIGTDVGEEDENVHEQEAYQVALGQAGSLEDRLNDVAAALERMDDGTYGSCDNCDLQIPEERLEANPAARTCIDCAEKGTR